VPRVVASYSGLGVEVGQPLAWLVWLSNRVNTLALAFPIGVLMVACW